MLNKYIKKNVLAKEKRKSFNIFGKKSKIKKIFPDKRSNEHKNTKLGLIFRSKILLVD